MALVAYSDSEGSDNEAPVAPTTKVSSAPAKPAFSKSTEGPRKIAVTLPAPKLLQEGDETAAEQPPAKRARTTGGQGGFNSLLPAPKRPAAAPQGLKKGVNLKTSSEAAFSRAAPAVTATDGSTANDGSGYDEFGNPHAKGPTTTTSAEKPEKEQAEEVKIVGKATRFKPLSVANNRKKVVKKAKLAAAVGGTMELTKGNSGMTSTEAETAPQATAPPPRAKRSLFSVPQEEDEAALEVAPSAHEPLDASQNEPHRQESESAAIPAAPANSLEAVAADLNLTPAQRRQLFGRHGDKAAVNIAHFNMDSEYAANEQIRQAGETAEHRAVKSIAPGKHSLQQLVNNARSNQDSIEDKWAEGRRNQGGSNYGWSK
ncbi:hypothetical protein LTR36_009692 [Oleoguttula mirabilis]|uniref:Mitotic checkpoint regulator, MAD2B-interacting-domain-containing protein n=1 Tax=Oleoguttula mirabilis TaxID=1507867 RepID=A0AAV9J5E7_9PEZI|nr:hypothetical protein LTR36_009692 [Oleoguttula mirabilis]